MLPPCQLDSASSPSVTASRAPTDAGQRLGQPFGHVAPRGDIDGAQLASSLDQRELLGRRAADQPAIVVQRDGRARAPARLRPICSRAGPPWTTRAAAITPLQAVIRGEAGQRLVGAALEMAGAAGERVEDRRAVDGSRLDRM